MAAARSEPNNERRLMKATAFPVLHCCAAESIWEQGMGQALISRLAPNGTVTFATFLLDVYCLGVKDLLTGVAPRGRYESRFYDELLAQGRFRRLKPESLRKLVEGAVAYARSFGFEPHSDYQAAGLIFGDIDVAASEEQFTYGHDGKPHFIAGPNDDPACCLRITEQLARQTDGNFEFTSQIIGPFRTVQRDDVLDFLSSDQE